MRGMNKARCAWTLAAILSTLCAGIRATLADDPPEEPHELVTRVIDVSDVVSAATSADPDVQIEDVDALSNVSDLITSTVAVDSWDINGGRGGLRPSPAGNHLVITQTVETQAAIDRFLKDIRQPLRTTIVIETRLLAVDPKMLAADTRALLTDGAAADGALPAVLDKQKTDALLAGGRLNQWTVAAPRTLARSGQKTNVKIGSTTRYLAGYSVVPDANGKMAYKPVSDEVEQGISIAIRASASADRKTVSLQVHPKLQVLDKVAWTPADLGPDAPALMMQTPNVLVREINCDTDVPDGGMAIVGRLPAIAVPGLAGAPGAAALREGNDLYVIVKVSTMEPAPKEAMDGVEQKMP